MSSKNILDEIKDAAARRGFEIDKWIIDDGVSGGVEPEKRKLGRLLKRLRQGDILIAGEISRLGRSLFMVMRILEHCMSVGVRVYTVKDGYELGDNIQSKVMAFAFGLAAEIERKMISARTKEALALRRAQGVILGRPVGSKKKHPCLADAELRIKRMLAKGYSKKTIAHKLRVSRGTLYAKLHQMQGI